MCSCWAQWTSSQLTAQLHNVQRSNRGILLIFRILWRSGHAHGASDAAQQHDQSCPLRSPGTVLATHWCPLVVVDASHFWYHHSLLYLYQSTNGHWWNFTHFETFSLSLFISVHFWDLWTTAEVADVNGSGHYNLRAMYVSWPSFFLVFSMQH